LANARKREMLETSIDRLFSKQLRTVLDLPRSTLNHLVQVRILVRQLREFLAKPTKI